VFAISEKSGAENHTTFSDIQQLNEQQHEPQVPYQKS